MSRALPLLYTRQQFPATEIHMNIMKTLPYGNYVFFLYVQLNFIITEVGKMFEISIAKYADNYNLSNIV